MRKRLIQAALVFIAVVVVAQFIRPGRTNPPIDASRTIQAQAGMSAALVAVLDRACKDCHSNETRLPWYGKVAPLSWVIAGDVERARKSMNLSEWSTEIGAKPAVAMGMLMAACAGVEGQLMPPAAYQRMHPEARLTQTEKETLCGWTTKQAKVLRKQTTSRRTLALNR